MGVLPNGEYTDIPEEWFPLLDFYIPNIMPWYYVSNYGRIYNKATGNIIPQKYKETEYNDVRFSFKDGSAKNFRLHRIVAMVYCWNGPDFDYTREVNHIDGVKGHNWAWNLEWCTHKENIDHCIQTGLMPLGETRNNSVYTDEEVEKICKLISEGNTNAEIVSILGYSLSDKKIFKLIQNIKNGHCWKHISCKYDFSNAKSKNVFTNEMIHAICKYFEYNGTKITYKKILQDIGIDYSDMSEKELDCLNACICNLRTKTSFKEICNQYNYTHIPKSKK